MKLQHRSDWRARNVSIVIISISITTVVVSLVANYFFEPERVARRELQKLAQDYYEGYFYQTIVDKATENNQSPESLFSSYAEKGFPKVRLRQLLLHGNGQNLPSRAAFDASHYYCDENATSVIFTPHAPYGTKDYAITYDTSCQKR